MLNDEQLLETLFCGDEEQAERAAQHLAHASPGGAEALLPGLGAALTSPETEKRWWATRALAAIQHPAVVPLLLRALEDNEIEVRQCAALALRQHPDPQAVDALVARLSDEDALVARLAGEALIAIGEPAVLALVEVLRHGEPRARLEAARALAGIGDKRSLPALIEALDGSALVEYWANEAIERMGMGMVYFKP